MLRTELAFYIGCLNLHGQLAQMGEPVSFPVPVAHGEHRLCFQELYDVCLALTMKQRIVGNDITADGKDLVIITGANQGGKSTFLRSIGLSQLMMQCGMFVPAESFCANVCAGLFTHYKSTYFGYATYLLELVLLVNLLGAVLAAVGIYHNLRWGWLLGVLIVGVSFVLYVAQETVGLPGLPKMWWEPSRTVSLIVEALFVVLVRYNQIA
jgi:hypothetical protein